MDVSVNGVDFSPDGNADLIFQMQSPAYILSAYPDFGQMSGEAKVEVVGASFGDGIHRCYFGSNSVPARRVSATLLRCAAPAAIAVEEVALRVWKKDHGFLHGNLSFSFVPDFSIQVVSPSVGPASEGTVLDVHGVNFRNFLNLTCLFVDAANKKQASRVPVATAGVYISPETVRCVLPQLPGLSPGGVVHVLVSANGRELPKSFAVLAVQASPKVMKLTPSLVDSGATSVVTVTGRDFAKTDALACAFGRSRGLGGQNADATWLSGTQMLCHIRSLVPGRFVIEASNNGVDFSSDGMSVQVSLPVQVHAVTPSHGWVGRPRTVSVSGVRFPADMSAECAFGLSKAPARVVSSTVAVCFAPALSHGTHAFEMTVQGSHVRISSPSLSFSQRLTPTILRVTPSSGFVTGGTHVTIVANGNDSLDAITSCRFGRLLVRASQLSASEISCVSPPASSATPVVLLLEDGHDGGELRTGVDFAYLDVFVVLSVHPSEVSIHGGDRVTIIGANFSQAGPTDLAVTFGMRRLVNPKP